jgi:cellulose synthase/poly-beta-1,6-N-acetylglucosamine synthase-like glycosyltransferase
MYNVARRYARRLSNIKVFRKEERGGKSSCVNFALNYTQADVIIPVDTDSQLGPDALWEIVQPFRDQQVGAVSAAILVNNPFENFATWFQSYEYLHGIFIGRMVLARLNILAIASGAFGAFRHDIVNRLKGWDVGPGEDGDLTIRVRKAGYQVAFAPYAQCYTNVPTQWQALFKQRLRWNRGQIRYKCRKHLDLAFFWRADFRFTNLCVLLNIWIFNILALYGFWVYFLWLCLHFSDDSWKILLSTYVAYGVLQLVEAAVVLFYSRARLRDAKICLIAPLVPIYGFFRKIVRLRSLTEELFFRTSFEDNYVPPRVRAATWHW